MRKLSFFLLSLIFPSFLLAQNPVVETGTRTLKLQDKGGQVFNVLAYGNSVGTGNTTIDTAAYNAAASACNTNNGGTVFFPAGAYILTSPNQLNPGVFSGTGYQVCSLAGAGADNTRITMITAGLTLSNQLITKPFYAGDVTGIQFEGSSLTAGNYCLRILDSVGWNIHECSFANTGATSGVIAVLYEINSKWCERNHISNSQFSDFNPSIEAKFDAATVGDFAYNFFEHNHFNENGDVFFATGTSGGGVLGNVFDGSANFTPTIATNSNWFHLTGSGNKIGPGNYFNLRDENDGAGTVANFCIDSGVTIASGTSLSGFVMQESGGGIGCSGTQAVNTNVDIWGRGFYSAQNGLFWGSVLNSSSGAPTPVGRLTGGTSNPGSCDTGLGTDPAGSIFTNNSNTSSGANANTIWGCIGQNYQPFVLRQGAFDAAGQNANVTPQTITTAQATGFYVMACETIITTRDAVSATLPTCEATWTDPDSSVAVSAIALASSCMPTQTTDTTQTTCQQLFGFEAKTGTIIQVQTTGYASNTPGQMVYSVHGRLLPM